MIGVEVFAGAGGMSIGAGMAGINVKMAVEIDSFAAETFIKNHPQALMFNDDIRKLKQINVNVRKNEQKILFGGPPCQGFSKSNHRTRNIENPNNWLFKEFVRVAKEWKPDWIVLENVRGLLQTERGIFIDEITKSFGKLGYSVNYKILNAVDFGVPQNRERLFIVGSLHGVNFQFPHKKVKKIISVKEALADLPLLNNGDSFYELPYKTNRIGNYAKELRNSSKMSLNNSVSRNSDLVLKRYEHIPQGGNWQDIPKKMMKTYEDSSRCHTGIYHRLDENKPAVVIGNYRKNMLIHPTQNRGLSVREAARLQSFPDAFEFHGFLGNQQQQVGNAVPPLLAKSIFNEIIKYVGNSEL